MEVHVDRGWVGRTRGARSRRSTGARVAFLTRLGSGSCPSTTRSSRTATCCTPRCSTPSSPRSRRSSPRHRRTGMNAEGAAAMRVAIAGAGNVGRSIAAELLDNGHEVLLIDKDPHAIKAETRRRRRVAAGRRLRALLARGGRPGHLRRGVAATGDDKANLVVSLLAKTEFGVPRTVARVNHPKNEWMFNEAWGVDVAVSTPRLMTALVEEAVTVGDLVRLLTFHQGATQPGRDDPAREQPVRRPPGRRPDLARRRRPRRDHPRRSRPTARPRRLARGRATSCSSSPPRTTRRSWPTCSRRVRARSPSPRPPPPASKRSSIDCGFARKRSKPALCLRNFACTVTGSCNSAVDGIVPVRGIRRSSVWLPDWRLVTE